MAQHQRIEVSQVTAPHEKRKHPGNHPQRRTAGGKGRKNLGELSEDAGKLLPRCLDQSLQKPQGHEGYGWADGVTNSSVTDFDIRLGWTFTPVVYRTFQNDQKD